MYSYTGCLLYGLKLTFERGYADCLSWGRAGCWQTDVHLGLTSCIEEGGTATPCFLTAVYVQNYTAERIVGK